MHNVLLITLALIWFAGIVVRIYRQARFYQIEEYKSLRYLRWNIAKRERWLLYRPLAATFIGLILAFFLSESPDSPLPGIILSIAAIIALLPPDEGEIKRGFKRTQRATRLLGGSFLILALSIGLLTAVVPQLTADETLQLLILAAGGYGLFLAAPLFLILGNTLMTPVEAVLRRQFINSAKSVMNQINPTVIGITGSYGKTTTKNYITEILNGRYKAYATPKSYNTMMGVCIAINNDIANDFSIDYFVVEMGAYIRGEIQRICGLTPPQISVVVEVGPQHLERFGSLENIAIAKYEIIKALPPDGVGIFNWDNPYVREMYERNHPQTRIAVSRTLSPDDVPTGGPRLIATGITESLNGLTFTVHDVETGAKEDFTTSVVGEHNVTNILLATAIALHEGMTLQDVAFRVRMLHPAESRLVRQTTAQGITIINDAYSANPVGVISALKVLAMHQNGKRLLITPGMVELADLHDVENRKLGQAAAQYATDVILVGEEQTRPIKAGLEDVQFPADRLQVVDTLSEAVQWYQSNLQTGDTVLFLNDLPDTY